MKYLINTVWITLILCSQAFAQVTNTVIIPLTWVGRSTESSSTVAYGPSRGSAVSAGLALPLDPSQVIFDNGTYAPRSGVPAGNQYAAWPQYGPGFAAWECRHFQAAFTLPSGLHDVVGFSLFSPYYTQYGNVIPINDNAYVYLNGTFLGARGVDYDGTYTNIVETDGWYGNGNFGSAPVASLQAGLNVLDIVAEERLISGQMGLINVALLDVVPEPNTALLLIGAIAVLACALRRRLV